MTVKKIGTITLTYPLWWTDRNQAQSVKADVQETISGGTIVWEQAVATNAKNITLSSETSGWQTSTVKEALLNLVNGSIGTTTTITTTADEVISVRFRHENSGGAMKAERVVGNKLFDFYNVNLYLARI